MGDGGTTLSRMRTGSACTESRICLDLSKEEAGQQPCLYLKNPSVADGIAKARMCHQRIQPTLIGINDTSAPTVCQGHSACPRHEIGRAQFTVVDEANGHGIGHQWAELFHQIEGQGRASIAWLMVKTQIRIKAHTYQRDHHLFGEQGIEKRQQRIDRVAWGTAVA